MNIVNDCWRSTRWLDDFIYSLFGKTIERNNSYSFSCREECTMIASENEKINMLIVCLEALGAWGHFLLHNFLQNIRNSLYTLLRERGALYISNIKIFLLGLDYVVDTEKILSRCCRGKNTQTSQDSNSLELDIFSTWSFISLWGRSEYYFSETITQTSLLTQEFSRKKAERRQELFSRV